MGVFRPQQLRYLHMIWGPWLNNVFNKVDPSRIEAVGPDIACAEWLLRCGAQVKYSVSSKYHGDYNALPKDPEKHKIEEIDATESSISSVGFEHLKGLHHVTKAVFHKCRHVDDEALSLLVHHLGTTLEELKISSCGNVTDKGVMSLSGLTQLRRLYLFNLPAVRDPSGCVDLLRKGLTNCTIDYPFASDP